MNQYSFSKRQVEKEKYDSIALVIICAVISISALVAFTRAVDGPDKDRCFGIVKSTISTFKSITGDCK
jgi:hypothetical protein